MSSDSTRQIEAAKPVQRWEWAVLLGIMVIAAGLRFCFPGHLAIEHFDEGVYASNIWFGDRPGGVYPEQHLYAPPLLAALIEWAFVFFGPSNAVAMWPSQLAGTVTVILLWWLGRSWFGPVAGLTAAALCATSEVHILLSRAALTDVLLGMWWLAALLALRRACDSGRWSHSLLAGYLVGMAWYTKYNGWMPLAITIAAVVARWACCRGIWPQTRTALKSCLVAGITAFVVWSPWLWSLQSKGGYVSVMANHRQYVVGLSGWLSSLARQWEQLTALTGRLSLVTLFVTYAAIQLLATRRMKSAPGSTTAESPGSPIDPDSFFLALFRVLTQILGSAWIAWGLLSPVISFAALTLQSLTVWWCFPRQPSGATQLRSRDDLGHWLLLVWFGGLLIVTPLYHPYFRLTLPWLLSAVLGLGLSFQQAWNATSQVRSAAEPGQSVARNTILRVIGLLILAGLVGGRPFWSGKFRMEPLPIADHRFYSAMTGEMASAIIDRSTAGEIPIPASVYVYGEPALLFQLRVNGLPSVGPIGSLTFMERKFSTQDAKVYLAIGGHAKSDPAFLEQFKQASGQLKFVGSWPIHISALIALDRPDCEPRNLGTNRAESSSIELYEVLPP